MTWVHWIGGSVFALVAGLAVVLWLVLDLYERDAKKERRILALEAADFMEETTVHVPPFRRVPKLTWWERVKRWFRGVLSKLRPR